MGILRSYGQFHLNKGDGIARGLYNVTNNMLLRQTKDEGASYWFGEDLKNDLMRMSDATFGRRCVQLAGGNANIEMPT